MAVDLTDPVLQLASSTFPGNAQPAVPVTTATGNETFMGTISQTWDAWASDVKSAAMWPVNKAKSAYNVVADMPHELSTFVSNAEESAVSAATGIGTWLKWLLVVLGLLAVAYILAIFAPALRGKK